MDSNYNIFPLYSNPFGKSYSEWTVEWWKWLCESPKNINPSSDNDGRNVHVNQHHPNILFLCQTIEGSKKAPIRKNYLTNNTSIFMPIINWISIEGIDGNSKEELKYVAKSKMDVIDKLEVSINGTKINGELKNYRVHSEFFYVNFPSDNIFDIKPGNKICISDGYWIFIRPIDENLEIFTSSSCSSGTTTIEVKYLLTTKKEKIN